MQLFKIFSRDLLQRLSVYVEEISYGPEDVIIAQGQVDDSSVYFVQSGEVQIKIFDRTNSQIGKIKPGGSFGEYGFFTGLKRTATIQSCGYSKLLKIKRKYMMEAIQINQKDKEIFSNIQDQLMINNNFTYINMKCICCSESNHLAVQCPIIHYKADKERIIKQLNYPTFQERQKVLTTSRANTKKISSRKNQEQIELNIREYQSSVLFEQSHQISSADELSQESGLPYDENMQTSQSQFTAQVSQKSYLQQNSLLINPMESINFVEYENPIIFESSLNGQAENQIRVNEQKFSYSTAGFGNHSQLKDSKSDMNIIDEKNNEEEISSQEEKKSGGNKVTQTNQLVPPRRQHNFRTVNSKLTFNHNQEQSKEFKQSSNEEILGEIASQFSSGKDKGNLQQQNQFSAQNKQSDINSSGSVISQRSRNLSKSHSASYKRSNNSIISNNNIVEQKSSNSNNNVIGQIEQRSQNSNNNIIGQIEQNSNNNIIGQSQNQSQFAIIDQLNNSNITQTLYFKVLDFERLHQFQEYFPHNNYQTVINQYRKYQSKKKGKKQQLSNYTFRCDLIQRATQLIVKTQKR